jgi:protein-tyrosine phosphatase
MNYLETHCNQLVPGLFIGPVPPEGDTLATLGINVLVLCADENKDPSKYSNITVLVAPGSDADPMRAHDDKRWYAAGIDVAQRVTAGQRVLVTCMQGQNRSGFVCAVAMHRLRGWSGTRSVQYVRKHRPNALWNNAFVRWLVESLLGNDQ